MTTTQEDKFLEFIKREQNQQDIYKTIHWAENHNLTNEDDLMELYQIRISIMLGIYNNTKYYKGRDGNIN